MKRGLLAILVVILFTLSGCASTAKEGQVYRGGVPIYERPLDIQDHYSFLFVNKWRISHAWLGGPTELRPCSYGGNLFKRLGEYGALEVEKNEPLIEKDGIIYDFYEHRGKIFLSHPRERIYGTNPQGEFKGYSPFCGHGFKDSLDFVVLFIIKPDSAKGTDEWIEGAKPVTINGLNWLHKELPIQDWSRSKEKLASPTDYWVLKIPDTSYWMVLRFSASSGEASKYPMGAIHHPEKHSLLQNLFRKIVESVRLEAITPIDMDSLIETAAENRRQKELAEQKLTPEEKKNQLHCIAIGSISRAFDSRCK